ncbi:S41 family peptidase [Puniceicoccaceae bacterium K14]|nr:S41 family peptidase [Puniceicoccaceae bacterium K14]
MKLQSKANLKRLGTTLIFSDTLKAKNFIKSIFFLAVLSVALFQAFRLGVGVARHGSLSNFLDSRDATTRLERVLDLIDTYYVDLEDADSDTLADTALESLLDNLDPYSEYMNPERLNDLKADTSQEFGGIGVQVEFRDEQLIVVAPIEGSPADGAGVLSGDIIIEVEGESVEGEGLSGIVKVLRGKPGSSVQVGVYRPASDEKLSYDLVREVIEVDSVRGVEMLTDKIGYLRISQFGAKTGTEVTAAITQLENAGMKGLVIDLRNNPGGLLEAAVEVVEPFLEKDQLVVYTEGRHPDANERWLSQNNRKPYDLELIVLINSGTASASEIVAGALRDYNLALIVGEKSFGKGSVQRVLDLGGGSAIKLTTAKYYTPGGYVIHGEGIEPDVMVETTLEENRKLSIQKSRLKIVNREEFAEQYGFEPIEDQQLQTGVELLERKLSSPNGL